MPWTSIDNLGAVGVVKDIQAPRLPLNAWSDANNARMLDGAVTQALGHGSIYDTPPVTPLHVLPIYLPGSKRYWMYASTGKIYAVSAVTGSTVHTDITKAATTYSGAANQWTSTSLSGLPVLNNGIDAPQSWTLDLSAKCTDLPHWTSGVTAKSVRAFKNQLVALNITDSGTRYPYMVWWSSLADPGALPASWDVSDPTTDAGQIDLAEGGDPIIDGMQLGGTFMVYKEHSAWRMDYAGGQFVEQFTKVGGVSGAANLNCICEVEIGGVPMHVVLTNDDVVVHDGQTARSVLDKQARRTLFQAIDAQNNGLAFVFKNPFLNEVFVCYPEAGQTICNKALVWNYADGVVWFRDIPSLNHANFGPVESSVSQPWDSDSSPWDSDVSVWNGADFTPDASRVMMASSNGKLYLLDSSTTFDGTLPSVYLERRGLRLAPTGQRTLIKNVRLRVNGSLGDGGLVVKVGGADDPYSDPSYPSSGTYAFGTKDPVGVMADAMYPAIRIEGTSSTFGFKLDGLDIEWEASGAY